jgi:ElaB/YqjD/DUF883 family membrane-anchored ribosome-binding protein
MTQQKAAYPLDYSKTEASTSKDRLDDMAAKATDQLGKVTENAQEIAGKLAEQAQRYGEQAQEAAKKFKPYVEKQMKEQPMATLAVAAAIGLLLGAMWKK